MNCRSLFHADSSKGRWDGSEINFDIKREIYPKVAGYLATKGHVLNIDLSRGLGNQYDPLQGAYQ